MNGPPGISRSQYRRRCAALGREPGELLSPVAREAALPAWLYDELIATSAAVAKLQAWARHAPPPVVAYVERPVVFARVSHDGGVLGGCSPRPHWARPWFITRSKPERFDELLMHECAHAWLLPEPPPGAELETAFQTATLQYAPLARGPSGVLGQVAQRRAQYQADERQEQALVKRWGLAGLF